MQLVSVSKFCRVMGTEWYTGWRGQGAMVVVTISTPPPSPRVPSHSRPPPPSPRAPSHSRPHPLARHLNPAPIPSRAISLPPRSPRAPSHSRPHPLARHLTPAPRAPSHPRPSHRSPSPPSRAISPPPSHALYARHLTSAPPSRSILHPLLPRAILPRHAQLATPQCPPRANAPTLPAISPPRSASTLPSSLPLPVSGRISKILCVKCDKAAERSRL